MCCPCEECLPENDRRETLRTISDRLAAIDEHMRLLDEERSVLLRRWSWFFLPSTPVRKLGFRSTPRA